MKGLEKGELIKLEDNLEYLVLERITCGLTTYLYLFEAGKGLRFEVAKEDINENDLYITMVDDEEEKRYVLDTYQRLKNS